VNLKTYQAPSIADALARVKHDLGPDAVILHTRTFRRGGFLGFGGKRAVEITASSGVNVVHPLARKGKAPGQSPQNPTGRQHQPIHPAAQRARRAYSEAGEAARSFEPVATTSSGTSVPPMHGQDARTTESTDRRPAPTTAPARQAAQAIVHSESTTGRELENELASIKRMVGQVLQSSRQNPQPAMPEALFTQYLRLLESEVATEIADEFVAAVRDELHSAALADGSAVRARIRRRLEKYIPTPESAPTVGKPDDGRPLTIALVGPTGVGKTTTIAKLAATYKLRRGKKVGLVTCDTYRIAAVDQLRTYANIIGLQLNIALTPSEMANCVASLNDCDVILIDTAGRSQHDSGRLEELCSLLEAAKPHETHLVLSGATSEAVLMRSAERFGVAKPNRVILTKLDETVNFGVLINAAWKIGASLSYVTTGQEVPEHIEQGRPDRLARLVLEEGAVR